MAQRSEVCCLDRDRYERLSGADQLVVRRWIEAHGLPFDLVKDVRYDAEGEFLVVYETDDDGDLFCRRGHDEPAVRCVPIVAPYPLSNGG